MLLRNCRYLVTQNAARDILERVDVLIVGNRIAEIGEGLARRHAKERIIDCSERIVMPGLVNAHTHLGMSGLRGLSDDKELAAWLAEIIEAEHARDREQMLSEAVLGVRESLRMGTTCCCDMYMPSDVAADAAAKLGLRVVNCTSFFAAHNTLVAKDIPKLMPSKRYPATVTNALGPHSIYGTDEGFLKAVRSFATERKMLIHIHVAETRHERVSCKERTGMLPVEYLDSIGFLGPDVLIAHAVWLTKGELDILAARGVKVVHCPQSNMKLAGGGVMPLAEMHERGITVALGTDSTASNNSLDMFREMHTAALLHKHHYWDATAAPAQTVLDMATVDGARALGLECGSIAPGMLADVIMLDATDINLQPLAKERLISHLVYAANGLNVSDVIVDGKLLLKDKRFLKKST